MNTYHAAFAGVNINAVKTRSDKRREAEYGHAVLDYSTCYCVALDGNGRDEVEDSVPSASVTECTRIERYITGRGPV